MKKTVAALALVVAVSGCKGRGGEHDDQDTARHAADTNVVERTVRDTQIVTHDTIIRSDTIVKSGTGRDTARRARPRP
jgi:hypothetical protein